MTDDTDALIGELRDPAAYAQGVDRVEVIQTHISVVFLVGESAYKIKKPVDLGFVDYSTLARRKACCEAEVELNRRLAPGVYRGVVPIVREGGGLRMAGAGEAVEYAVHMRRLPEDRTLAALLRAGGVTPDLLRELAARVAAFHAAARHGPDVARWGAWSVVAGNCRENFEQVAAHVGETVSRPVFEELRALTEEALLVRRDEIEPRVAEDRIRDCHGDLRLEHVYWFPEAEAPADLLVVDCIEFNERFRYSDPVADVAFLVMELLREGVRDLAEAFVDAYFEASGDSAGRRLIPLYVAYRAVVRGKVLGFKATESEVPREERVRARDRARGHFLLALGALAPPAARPCLLVLSGLPASGKSHLAEQLRETAGFVWIRSDVVRKELAGLEPARSAKAAFGQGLYAPEWSERVYAECLARAGQALFEGRRVLVDACFASEERRGAFLAAARTWGVRGRVVLLETEPERVAARLAARAGDASDADWAVYERMGAAWEPLGPRTRDAAIVLDGGSTSVLGECEAALRQAGLL